MEAKTEAEDGVLYLVTKMSQAEALILFDILGKVDPAGCEVGADALDTLIDALADGAPLAESAQTPVYDGALELFDWTQERLDAVLLAEFKDCGEDYCTCDPKCSEVRKKYGYFKPEAT